MTQDGTLATASSGKIMAWKPTTAASCFSSPSKMARFHTVSWYWMTSWTAIVASNAPVRNQAVRLSAPLQNSRPLCQNRLSM